MGGGEENCTVEVVLLLSVSYIEYRMSYVEYCHDIRSTKFDLRLVHLLQITLFAQHRFGALWGVRRPYRHETLIARSIKKFARITQSHALSVALIRTFPRYRNMHIAIEF